MAGVVGLSLLPLVLRWSLDGGGGEGGWALSQLQREVLHHLAEWTACLLATATFLIVSQAFAEERDGGTACVVSGLLASGLLDGLHALQSLGFAPAAADELNWCALSWTISRSVHLLAIVVGAGLVFGVRPGAGLRRGAWWGWTLGGSVALVAGGLALSQVRGPAVVAPGRWLTHPWDMVPLVLIGGAFLAIRGRRWRTALVGFKRGVLLAFVPLAAAQVLLVFGARHGVDFDFLAAHALKVLALLLTLLGVAADYRWSLLHNQRLTEEVRRGAQELEVGRQEAQLRLRESERRFRGVFEASLDAYFLIDLESDVILDANPRACELLGFSLDELCRMSIRDIHPHEMPRLLEFARLAREQGGARSTELSCLTKSGGYVPAEVSATFFTDHLGRHVMAAQVRDMSKVLRAREEKARLEQELNHSERLNSLGRLASGVAHDFNNLLTVMLAGGQEIAQNPRLDGETQAAGRMIHQAAKRAAELTGQLLAFGRRQPHHPGSVDLGVAVARMQPLLARVLPESIRLVIERPAAAVCARVDPVQLDQVIMNLCVNARDAMAGGGTLTLTVALEETGAAPAEAHAVLAVRDNGAGIERDSLDHIFEPFFTTKEQGRGTGLGLATVYGIVQQHGGKIAVASEVGRGTVFTVRLPAVSSGGEPAPPPETEPPFPGVPESREWRVLVVEDDPMVREAVIAAARRHARAVTDHACAADALAALERCAGDVDLVITDVVMPGMDGITMLREIRRRWPRIRQVVITGYSPEPLVRTSEEPLHVLTKPFTRTGFAAVLREAMAAPRNGSAA